MLSKIKLERLQVEFFNIEEFIPKDYLLRKIDSAIDFTHIYDFVSDFQIHIVLIMVDQV